MNFRERRADDGTEAKRPAPEARGLVVLHAAVLEHVLAGRYLEAQMVCRQALALDPENADTLHLVGVVCSEAKQFDHAVEWTLRAIGRDPKPQYLATLGTALLKSGRSEEAIKAFDKAVQLRPGDATLWWQMGDALIEAGRSSDAVLCFRHTLTLDPRNGDAAYKAGHILHALGQFEEALVLFNRSAELRPDHAWTLHMRGLVLKEMERFDEALVDSQRAIELDPANADACNNVGVIFGAMERPQDALSWYEHSLRIAPDQARTLANKGAVLTELGRFDEAMAAYRQSMVVDPNQAKTSWNIAVLQLLTGNFEEGLRGREVRWEIPEMTLGYPRLSGPMWLGTEAVAGKTIVVCADEGLGDSIQFARYIPMLAARGARVVLVVEEALRPILSKIDGVWQCLPKLPDTVLPRFDLHCPITNLPLAFEARVDSIPTGQGYLPPPEADLVHAWENRLGPRDKLRVGLVWSGNPKHVNDRARSMPFRMLSRILDVDATFVSLQKDPRPQDAELLREMPDIVDHTAHLTDYAETAALVSRLDLVITVDTSVAHLAGALGRPTWLLLPRLPDWRWLFDRDDTPWYPTVRLFRQTETRDYGNVVDRVRVELSAWVAARSGSVENHPDDADAAYRAGVLLKEEGRFDEALAHLDRSADAQPDHAPTFAMRGLVRANLKRYEQAVADYELAIRLDPQNAEACSNLGDALRTLGDLEKALVWYDRALALKPNIANATSRALTLAELGRSLEARAAYQYAMRIDPKNPSLVWNLSLFQLSLGDFEAGWRGREARWKVLDIVNGYPKLDTAMWIGEEPVAGKTVVVCQDEGVGDAIQFSRYVPMLAARGARVMLVVNQELCPLLSRLSGVSHCLPKKQGMVVPPFDFHIAIDSLPLAFGTRLDSIPFGKDYLPAPEAHRVQAWEDRLGRRERLRVGLVWSGNPRHANDRNRSVPLRLLSGILDVDATFVSLQKNPRAQDAETLRQRRDIVDHTAELTDFAETAALVSCLDLVITVDTSVAHLAGALGRPTWVLLPYVADWRWLLDREDSPWYPTVRLFRQCETRDYGRVVDRVRAELSVLVARAGVTE
jgi:Flp pilus assembly protein TadD/ADP-heptose:LPS heptosyltransferase